MLKVTVMKNGKHWSIYEAENGELLFTGKTRVECFREIMKQNMKLVEYQHGAQIDKYKLGLRDI